MGLHRLSLVLVGVTLALTACAQTGPARTTTSPTATPTSTTSQPPATESAPTAEVASTLPDGQDTSVVLVVDGDTIVVAGSTRVRLIGIDTPETKDPRKPVQCFAREASFHTAALIGPGTAVRLVFDIDRLDRYGRTLAYVYRLSDGLFINAALAADGFAQVATFPPNVAHVDELTELAAQARDAGRGLWAACATAPAPPSALTGVPPSPAGAAGCDPSYPGVCIPRSPPDLDCGDVAHRRFQVLPPDPHRFDGNGDGVGCE